MKGMKFLRIFILFFFVTNLMASGSYSFSLINMQMDYREFDANGNILDSEKANSIFGWEIGYTFNLNCDLKRYSSIVLKASEFSGYANYEGSELISGNPTVSSTYENVYDISLAYLEKRKLENFGILYGLEGGYHSWYRELSSNQNELYYWFYAAPTIGISKEIYKNFDIKLLLKYKYALNPKMKANSFSDDFKLGTTSTIELSIPFIYKYNNQVNIFTEYVISQQNIAKSNFVSGYIDGKYYNTIYEPDSTANNQYIKFGFTFKY